MFGVWLTYTGSTAQDELEMAAVLQQRAQLRGQRDHHTLWPSGCGPPGEGIVSSQREERVPLQDQRLLVVAMLPAPLGKSSLPILETAPQHTKHAIEFCKVFATSAKSIKLLSMPSSVFCPKLNH